jgi:hypothetical protein
MLCQRTVFVWDTDVPDYQRIIINKSSEGSVPSVRI